MASLWIRVALFGDAQLALVDAQRGHLPAVTPRARAEAKRVSDSVAFFIALGSCWGGEKESEAGRGSIRQIQLEASA
ncbi:hypothetical protein DSM21852_42450 (plasmid) [Methylocystis bryophila]|uniref:Uncharacterized protein n=1 Tax=Methylocystis bryophila TaxID=655015 RepID=A0A1W6N230_9HYPH|nr:hypothetical protein B1812_21675 [Methylocystis bryophila]BDV40991.1 hypothetical protein DSM21852_42450 [Methylocystis bryophila]